MKLLRYRDGNLVKPGILDKENKVRKVSSLVKDWNSVTISAENIDRIKNIDLSFELNTEATKEELALLIKLTERYCVVFQTLRCNPKLSVTQTSISVAA